MNINEFLQICDDFFKKINPNIYDDEDVDEVKTYEDDEDECFCNLCSIVRKTLFLITPKMKSN